MIRLFRIVVPTSVVALLVSETILIIGSYLAAYALVLPVDYDLPFFLFDDLGLLRTSVPVLVILFGLYLNDLYTHVRVRYRVQLLQQLCSIVGTAFLLQALVGYFNREWILPKWAMIVGSAISLIVLFVWRLLFSLMVRSSLASQRVLFLGHSPVLLQVANHLLDHPELGLLPIGFLDEMSSVKTSSAGTLPTASLRRLGSIEELPGVAKQQRPDRVVVGMSERRQCMPTATLLDLRFSGTPIDEVSELYEITFGRVCVREIKPSQLIFSEGLKPRRGGAPIQTLYSRVLALIGLVVAAPIMILVAIAVKLTSAGPVFFRQQRVGLHERVFTLYKFRSMYQDAEAKTGPVWATANDPRVTPLGGWLRKLRLDELPQLINVLRGDMAMVGPRPERPEFVRTLSEKIPFYRQRHVVMPGITGWAQINYKYGDTIEDTIVKLEYDLYYIKQASVWFDWYIMFHTIKTMLLWRGAQ